MIALNGAELVSVWPNLFDLGLGFDMSGADAATVEEAREKLGRVVRLCEGLGWTDLAEQTKRLLSKAEDNKRGTVMLELCEDLKHALETKLHSLQLIAIEERDRTCFENATYALCSAPLKPEFASSEEELNLAGKALAVGLSTACVSHAMRSIEASLHVLARLLNVSFPAPVELQDWAVLTDKIQKEIDRQQNLPRSQAKNEGQKTLSRLIIQADHFRLAWRNHVQHAREKYEAEEARKILVHVGDYLKALSGNA